MIFPALSLTPSRPAHASFRNHQPPIIHPPTIPPFSADPLIARCLAAWEEHQAEAHARSGPLQRVKRALRALADRAVGQQRDCEVVFLPTGCLVRLYPSYPYTTHTYPHLPKTTHAYPAPGAPGGAPPVPPRTQAAAGGLRRAAGCAA